MKNTFVLLIIILSFVSCDNKEKYQGKWTYNYYSSKYKKQDYPSSILIGNDSIKFKHCYFEYWHEYPLNIEGKKLSFNGMKINTAIIKDTLIMNNFDFFIKDYNDDIHKNLWGNSITKIHFPKIDVSFFPKENYKSINYSNYHIFFGRKLDDNELSLQLNDTHSEISEIVNFLHLERSSIREELIPFYKAILFIDKSSPMKFVEEIFYNLKIANQLKVSLVNNINLNYNDTTGIHYKYESLNKKLPYFKEVDNYNPNTSKWSVRPPPPVPRFNTIFSHHELESKFIILKQNNLHFNDKTITASQLRSNVKPWVENNMAIFSLYDLESTYEKFLEMTAIIDSVYQEVRENQSKLMFNKTLSELNREEYTKIKLQNPLRHIWSYSIPHYNSIVEENNSFWGLKVESIN